MNTPQPESKPDNAAENGGSRSQQRVDMPLGAPGSDQARSNGCICPVLDNAHGKGWMCIEGVYVQREDCPLHGLKRHIAGGQR